LAPAAQEQQPLRECRPQPAQQSECRCRSIPWSQGANPLWSWARATTRTVTTKATKQPQCTEAKRTTHGRPAATAFAHLSQRPASELLPLCARQRSRAVYRSGARPPPHSTRGCGAQRRPRSSDLSGRRRCACIQSRAARRRLDRIRRDRGRRCGLLIVAVHKLDPAAGPALARAQSCGTGAGAVYTNAGGTCLASGSWYSEVREAACGPHDLSF